MFGERLKALRTARGLTQEELCQELGIVRKTLSDYENGRRYPKSTQMISKICTIFEVSSDFLIGKEDELILEAGSRYGARGSAKARKLINETTALFAGGELNEEDKELVFRAISELFWETREENKKYARKPYLPTEKR